MRRGQLARLGVPHFLFGVELARLLGLQDVLLGGELRPADVAFGGAKRRGQLGLRGAVAALLGGCQAVAILGLESLHGVSLLVAQHPLPVHRGGGGRGGGGRGACWPRKKGLSVLPRGFDRGNLAIPLGYVPDFAGLGQHGFVLGPHGGESIVWRVLEQSLPGGAARRGRRRRVLQLFARLLPRGGQVGAFLGRFGGLDFVGVFLPKCLQRVTLGPPEDLLPIASGGLPGGLALPLRFF